MFWVCLGFFFLGGGGFFVVRNFDEIVRIVKRNGRTLKRSGHFFCFVLFCCCLFCFVFFVCLFFVVFFFCLIKFACAPS